MNAPQEAVVVGVGADGSPSAVVYAVQEARRAGRPLRLVHVLQLPATDAYVGGYSGLRDAAHSILDDARRHAEQLAGGGVPVSATLIDDGWVVDDLAHHTGDTALLVLQHRAFNRVKRVFTGSVVQSVAGRADSPVISVPEGWQPHPTSTPLVTAAVQDPVEAGPLLRAGFEEARARGTELAVLHAWWLSSVYDALSSDAEYREQWASRSRAELEPVLAPLRREFPDVRALVSVVHAPPTEAVLDAAEVSALLVLGRRHHLLPLDSHLGPVARAALGQASCPVLIAPEVPPAVRERPGEEREQRAAGPELALGLDAGPSALATSDARP